MTFGLIASLEAEEELELTTDESGDAEVATPDSPQVTDEIEVQAEVEDTDDVAEEIEDDDQVLEEAVEAFTSLEGMIESLETISENGGLDRFGAAMYNHARENIHARFGIQYKKEDNVSLEGFGNISSRESATRISLEEEKGMFKSMWEKIWQFIKSIADKIKSFFTTLFSASAKLQKRAGKLIEDLRDGPWRAKFTDSEAERFSGILYGKKGKQDYFKVDEAANMIANSKAIINENGLSTESLNSLQKLGRWIANKLKGDAKPDATEFDKEIISIINDLSKIVKFTKDNSIKNIWNQGDGNYYRSEYLPGGWVGTLYTVIEEDEDVKFRLGFVRVVKKATNAAKVKDNVLPVNKREGVAILQDVIKICKQRDEAVKTFNAFDKQYRDYLSGVKQSTDGAMEKIKNIASKVMSFVRGLFTSITKPLVALSNYTVKIAKSFADAVVIASREPETAAKKK